MRRFTLLLLLLLGTTALRAQDKIVTTDNKQIEARVLEITLEEVSFKRFNNPEGPTYRLPVSALRYIEYPNGLRDEFQPAAPQAEVAETAPAPAPDPAPEAPASQPAAAPAAAKRYAVGDYYAEGDIRGVVLMTTDGGRHGLIISLDQTTTHWDSFDKEQPHTTGATDRADGERNMATLEAYIAANNLSWDHFPAAAWCRSRGEGWYLPAIDELLAIAFHFNGDNRTIFNRKARQKVNNTLKEHGGKRLDPLMYYYSSSEEDAQRVLIGHMDTKPPYVEPYKKGGISCLVRAVRKF